MKQLVILLAIAAALFMAMPTISTAETVSADFEDALGISTDYVDAYQGKAGDGWNGPWAFDEGTCRSTDVRVKNTNPLTTGSENYLSFTTNSTTSGDARSGTVVRSYTGSNVDLTAPHYVEFSVRIDEDLTAGSFTSSSDRYCFYDAVDHQSMSSTETSWGVCIYGDRVDTDGTTDVSRHWLVYDYADPTYAKHFEDTGIEATQGVVYNVKVMLDPENGLYDCTITGSDNSSATLTGLDMGNPNGDGTVPGYLNLSNTVKNDNSKVDHRAMSVDMIKISDVPEPTALAMLLGMAVLGLGLRRR